MHVSLKQAVTGPRTAAILVLLMGLLGVVGSAVPAHAWTRGLNRVQTAQADHSAATGYGPGWVAISYKTNGPAVGYLFAAGFRFADGTVKRGSDRLDIRGTRDYKGGHPTITRWPWGYAYGSFKGCAYAYGTAKFAKVRKRHATGRCAKGPRQGPGNNWWHGERAFCTAHRVDKLCSPAGVWSTGKPKHHHGTKPARSLGCTVYGNIGASGVFGRGPSTPRDPVGHVSPTSGKVINVRYVTKDRRYVLAKWRGHRFAGGIRWAFFPRGCLTLKAAGQSNLHTNAAPTSLRVAAAVPSCRSFWRHSGHTTRVRWYHCHRTSDPFVKRVHICGKSGTLHGVTVAQFPGNVWLRNNHRHARGGEGC